MIETDFKYIRRCIEISDDARANGNHPFGALLVGPDGEILIERGNSYARDKGPGHAEMNVAREAAIRYDTEFLAKCTLYTSIEPCSMCAGGLYWAGIGALVYGVSEERLAQLTGDNEENLTMSLPCRQVLGAGQRDIEIRGPYSDIEADVVKSHEGFWQNIPMT